jgi:hypothetical protein
LRAIRRRQVSRALPAGNPVPRAYPAAGWVSRTPLATGQSPARPPLLAASPELQGSACRSRVAGNLTCLPSRVSPTLSSAGRAAAVTSLQAPVALLWLRAAISVPFSELPTAPVRMLGLNCQSPSSDLL